MAETVRATIRGIMRSGRWYTIPQLQRMVRFRTGIHAMETTISARIRDLRKVEYYGLTVDVRKDPNSKLRQYRVPRA